MICVSIREPTPEAVLRAVQGITFAEVRLDGLKATIDDMKTIFSAPASLIATFRPEVSGMIREKKSDRERRKVFLMAAIDGGAHYIDIESGSRAAYRKDIIERARSRNCKVIISFHDYQKTPGSEKLAQIVSRCFNEGADIAKIACTVISPRDNLRLLNILSRDDFYGRTVVIGMGTRGMVTRIAAPLLGSPFTFAALSADRKTADGQIEKDTLEHILKVLDDER